VLGGVAVGLFFVSKPGMDAMSAGFRFLAFYAGVFSLVALSLTVMGGLAATDRIVLMVRHRVLLQGVHRSMATVAMVFLVIHILTKIAQGHASVVDVIIPFLANHRVVYIGLGTIASYLMILVTVTGVLRGRFAGTARPWMWRMLHTSAYLCWPIALMHGLNAGRPAKAWVVVSYVLCLVLVGLALLVRVWVSWNGQLKMPKTRTAAVHDPVKANTAVPTWVKPTRATNRDDDIGWHQPAVRPPRIEVRAAQHRLAADDQPKVPKPVGRWTNNNADTITDEEFWAYLRNELGR
jgi:hypothetical protein